MNEIHKNVNLQNGCEWADHEDYIIGDEQGLKNLILACQKAIQNGEHKSSDLGTFVGVKKLDSDWFKDPNDSKSTKIGNVILSGIFMSIFGLIIIGGITLFKWIFN